MNWAEIHYKDLLTWTAFHVTQKQLVQSFHWGVINAWANEKLYPHVSHILFIIRY